MGKLMKYEFRKIRNIALGLLVVTGIAEVGYLIGLLTLNPARMEDMSDSWLLTGGILALIACAVVGVQIIGLISILIFHNELNTKQCFMLFMTPQNSYQILGAKVLENGISLAASGGLYGGLAIFDLYLLMQKGAVMIDGGAVGTPFGKLIMQAVAGWTASEVFETIAAVFSLWLIFIVLAFFAVVLPSTFFNGRKGSGWISFGIFLALSAAVWKLVSSIQPPVEGSGARTAVHVILALALSAVFYILSGWIMDRKLSV